MTADADLESVRRHWERAGLAAAILDALRANGQDPASLTVDDLAPLDQFHGGGLALTRRLASRAGLERGMRVLDVGGGLGGPARTLATEHGCHVTVVDLAASYVEAGQALTALLRLEDRVTFQVGDAQALPFADGTFDVIWTQNSGMNIPDKDRLYAGFRRVVRTGGRLVTQEPMAGPGGPRRYPHMWASDPTTDHLRSTGSMRAAIEGAAFRIEVWEEVTSDRPMDGARPPVTVQALVMGEARLAEILRVSRADENDRRVVTVHAVATADAER